MHPAPMDTAPEAKQTTTTTTAETKTSEKKNRTIFYVFISTHPLPLSLIVPSVANTLSARNAAKTISQR
jgi:hypothetical protein